MVRTLIDWASAHPAVAATVVLGTMWLVLFRNGHGGSTAGFDGGGDGGGDCGGDGGGDGGGD